MEKITAETKQVKRMEIYRDLKEKHPDTLILLRCGDFYETFDTDAETAQKLLGITLTTWGSNPMKALASFPHYALDTYLPKLIRAGHRVAICDGL